MPSLRGTVLEECTYLLPNARSCPGLCFPHPLLSLAKTQWEVIKVRSTLPAVTTLGGGIDPGLHMYTAVRPYSTQKVDIYYCLRSDHLDAHFPTSVCPSIPDVKSDGEMPRPRSHLVLFADISRDIIVTVNIFGTINIMKLSMAGSRVRISTPKMIAIHDHLWPSKHPSWTGRI